MKRLVLLISFATTPLLLGGCTSIYSHDEAVLALRLRQLVCIDGVEYVAIPIKDSWAIAPHYKPDGTLFTCTDPTPRGLFQKPSS
jgi:hypothetical protein